MYGTVARVRVKPGGLAELMRLADSDDTIAPGYIGQYVYQMDSDPDELFLVVMFEDKETYFANAHDPRQNERFEQMVPYFASQPEWHDGEIVYHHHV